MGLEEGPDSSSRKGWIPVDISQLDLLTRVVTLTPEINRIVRIGARDSRQNPVSFS